MLCEKCQALVRKQVNASWTFLHHLTYFNLWHSANAGCELCKFLQNVLLNNHVAQFDSTWEEADKFHWSLDSVTTFNRVDHEIELRGVVGPFVSSGHQQLQGLVALRLLRRGNPTPINDTLSFTGVNPLLSIVVSKDSPPCLDGHFVGADLHPEAPIDLAKQWISDCQHSHEFCGNRDPSPLPTRLLDVGVEDEPQKVVLRATKGELGFYTTLSHRWGLSRPYCLNHDTKKALESGVALSTLPKTFRDAIDVTRRLGFRYIWIDCLCILQDSAKDWEQECVRMPKIYKNSQVNIAGPQAADCHAGFLTPRKQTLTHVEPVTVEWQGPSTKAIGRVTLLYRGFNPEPESVLEKRAWILQETLLCPRMLFFGSQKLIMHCCVAMWHEDMHYPSLHNGSDGVKVQKMAFRAQQRRNYWLRQWYRIVGHYSETDMTFEVDKLPAISALAHEFSLLLNDSYIAGLWRKDLLRGLTWHVAPTSYASIERRRGPATNCYIAPSWSWASSKHGLESYALGNLRPPTWDAVVLDAASKPEAEDPFGKLKGGTLKLECRTFSAQMILDLDQDEMQPVWGVSTSDGKKLMRFYPDDPETYLSRWKADETGEEGKFLDFLYLGRSKNEFCMALALESSVESPATYVRTGFLKMELKWLIAGNTRQLKIETSFDLSDRRVVVLL